MTAIIQQTDHDVVITCTCGRLALGWPGHDTGCPLRTDAQDAYDLAAAALEMAIGNRKALRDEVDQAQAAYDAACDDEEAAAAELARHEAYPGVPAFSHGPVHERGECGLPKCALDKP
jgi:hypothetical protein